MPVRDSLNIVGICAAERKPATANHCYYGFHAKWAPNGDRLLFTVRGVAHPWALHFDTISSPLHFYIFTMRPDGCDLHCVLDALFWNRKGHHINFAPDGSFLTMNHALNFDHLRFVRCALVRCALDGKIGAFSWKTPWVPAIPPFIPTGAIC